MPDIASGTMINPSLKITQVISEETVDLHPPVLRSKEELFQHVSTLLYKAAKIDSQTEFLEAVRYRESLGPTYMGNFIAIPHGKSRAVRIPSIAFVRSLDGIFYESCGESGWVKIVFLLAIPDQMATEEYIRALSQLARLLIHESFLEDLYRADDYADFYCAVEVAEAGLEL